MIPRITRGSSAAAALGYDFGPGRREEHVDARTVAGNLAGYWQDQAATMDTVIADRAAAGGRGQQLTKAVWRTSLRAAPQDRTLTDAEWGQIAERYITAMGLAGHPWTATRHGDDHIHLTASRVSWEGRVASLSHDFAKAQSACRVIEREHHLIDASTRYDRAKPQVVHGEREYAARRGLVPEREQLRARVGAVVDQVGRAMGPTAGARGITGTDVETIRGQVQSVYEAHLKAAGVVFRANVASTGRMSGYSYGLAGHLDAGGEQVFFKGSQLGKSYSWAATRQHLTVAVQRAMMTKQAQARARAQQPVQGEPAQEKAALTLADRMARAAQARVEEVARLGSSTDVVTEALERVRQQLGQRPGQRQGAAAGEQHRAPAAAHDAAVGDRPAAQLPGQPGEQTQQPSKPKQQGLVSDAERERLRREHEVVQARTAELQRTVKAAERDHDQAQQALATAQRDLQAALRDRSDASGWVAQARGEVTRAAGDLEALRAQVAGRSWLGRARQQLAEDWGSVTGGRAGAPRGQVQAQLAAGEDRLRVAREYLGRRQRILESVEARVSVARDRVAQAEPAVPATRLVTDRARVAYSQAVMRPTEFEQLTYREYLASNPEAARRRQEALDPTSAVNRARRRNRSPGPGRDPDRGRGFGR